MPHPFPLARISKGKISAGYSHGTVSYVAPKMAVKRNTKKVAPIPDEALVAEPSRAFYPSRDMRPTRKQQMPMPTDL